MLESKWIGTLILFWRVPDHSIEESDLAEEHGDEEGGASGVWGGGQEGVGGNIENKYR